MELDVGLLSIPLVIVLMVLKIFEKIQYEIKIKTNGIKMHSSNSVFNLINFLRVNAQD